jgi:hypothetical protein
MGAAAFLPAFMPPLVRVQLERLPLEEGLAAGRVLAVLRSLDGKAPPAGLGLEPVGVLRSLDGKAPLVAPGPEPVRVALVLAALELAVLVALLVRVALVLAGLEVPVPVGLLVRRRVALERVVLVVPRRLLEPVELVVPRRLAVRAGVVAVLRLLLVRLEVVAVLRRLLTPRRRVVVAAVAEATKNRVRLYCATWMFPASAVPSPALLWVIGPPSAPKEP